MTRLATLVACAALAAGCGSKKGKSAPEVSGLGAVPASATAVVVADVARVIDSQLVQRAVDQLLLRDPQLGERWQALSTSCKLDARALRHVVLAIGPAQGADTTGSAGTAAQPGGPDATGSTDSAAQSRGPGTGPVLMIVTGKLVETELAACVRSMVGKGGGTLTAKDLGGRTLYQAKEGSRTMYFAFGKADTVVLGSNEPYVTEALGTGKKLTDNAELSAYIKLANQKAPLWAAGKVDERVRGGLVKLTSGQVKQGPAAMVVSADPTIGLTVEVGAVMTSPEDAKTLESFAKTHLGVLAMGAQAKSLGKVVDKVTISADKEVVRFKAALGTDEVNLLISALDGGEVTAQDSPPATEPGSAAGSP